MVSFCLVWFGLVLLGWFGLVWFCPLPSEIGRELGIVHLVDHVAKQEAGQHTYPPAPHVPKVRRSNQERDLIYPTNEEAQQDKAPLPNLDDTLQSGERLQIFIQCGSSVEQKPFHERIARSWQNDFRHSSILWNFDQKINS